LTVFKPVLGLIDGEEQPWGDTIWIMNRLNELRVRTGHPQMKHGNVLRAVRDAMEKLGPEINLSNFVEIENGYTDVRGRQQPLIQFSQDVILNVCTAIGGPVEQQLIHQANVELNRLKKIERTGGAFDTAAIAAAVARVIGLWVNCKRVPPTMPGNLGYQACWPKVRGSRPATPCASALFVVERSASRQLCGICSATALGRPSQSRGLGLAEGLPKRPLGGPPAPTHWKTHIFDLSNGGR
jgi:hypothetical protein